MGYLWGGVFGKMLVDITVLDSLAEKDRYIYYCTSNSGAKRRGKVSESESERETRERERKNERER